MQKLLFSLMPKQIISRFLGTLANMRVPSNILLPILRAYCFYYEVNQEEMQKPLAEYTSFSEFFARPLISGARTINKEEDSIVSPVDGTISIFGRIQKGEMLQVKGLLFQVHEFIGEELAAKFEGGSFITIYLSPSNYHRIHMPVKAQVSQTAHIAGARWSVNEYAMHNIPGLYAVNERVINVLEDEDRAMALVAVGAFGVGSIQMPYPTPQVKAGAPIKLFPVKPKFERAKGEELGYFTMGSTVVLLFEKDKYILSDTIKTGQSVFMGNKIGTIIK